MDAYHNMSAPPRTTVKMVVRPIGKQIVFDAGCTGVGVAYNGKKKQTSSAKRISGTGSRISFAGTRPNWTPCRVGS